MKIQKARRTINGDAFSRIATQPLDECLDVDVDSYRSKGQSAG
jgi:hypothetical protein